MRDPGKVPGKISDVIPALGNWSPSVSLPAPPPRPQGQPGSGEGGAGFWSARPGAFHTLPALRAERGVRRSARGGARGGAGGAAPPEPGRVAPEAPDVPRPQQSRAPPSRRLRARLPAPSAVMGAAPCGTAPAPPRPFRPREPARGRGTAFLPPAAGLALLGGPGPGEVSSAPWRIP